MKKHNLMASDITHPKFVTMGWILDMEKGNKLLQVIEN